MLYILYFIVQYIDSVWCHVILDVAYRVCTVIAVNAGRSGENLWRDSIIQYIIWLARINAIYSVETRQYTVLEWCSVASPSWGGTQPLLARRGGWITECRRLLFESVYGLVLAEQLDEVAPIRFWSNAFQVRARELTLHLSPMCRRHDSERRVVCAHALCGSCTDWFCFTSTASPH